MRQKAQKDFEKWENSFEGVSYNLTYFDGGTREDDKNNAVIVETLLRLPKKVREKVLDEVIFIHTMVRGTVAEFHFTTRVEDKDIEKVSMFNKEKRYFAKIVQPYILLNFKHVKNSKKMDLVAHEIAHIILDHHKLDNRSSSEGEKAADDLAEKWGFKRSYKSYSQFKRVEKEIQEFNRKQELKNIKKKE